MAGKTKTSTKILSIEKYREVLLSKKAEFASLLRADVGRADDDHTCEDDLAPICHEEFIRLGTSQLAADQLRQIESAIFRLDRGDYGTCAACGDSITPKRLDAVPWASYCVECQTRIAA